MACAIWEGLVGQHFQVKIRFELSEIAKIVMFYFGAQVYLPWERIIPNGTFQGATIIGLLVFFSYAIVLNTVVPISLYVSVEVCYISTNFSF